MKKRIALATAIALAISVGGMLPAFAAKPTAPSVTDDTCVRTSSALEITADSLSQGTGAVSVSVASDLLTVDVDGSTSLCSGKLSWASLTSVTIKAEGDVTFDLEGASDQLANYRSVPFTTAAGGSITFDGDGLADPFYGISAVVTEETFTVGTLTGGYFAGSQLRFLGGAAGDSFDASAVTTTVVFGQGNAGDDTLKGGALGDNLLGGDGNDVIYGNGGNDVLNAVTEAVTATCPPAGNSIKSGDQKYKDCAVAGSGADEAWGGAGNDQISSNVGDTVAPGDGMDYITGSAAALVYSDSSAGITVNLKDAPHVVTSTAGNDYISGSAAAYVGSELDDTFVGDDLANVFYGGSGADKAVMYGGDDTVSAQGGADTVRMGAGNDFVYGDTGADLINGGVGDDDIYGMGGDDILYGSPGNDKLMGGKGSDQTWGGRGTDNCAGEVMDSCEFKR